MATCARYTWVGWGAALLLAACNTFDDRSAGSGHIFVPGDMSPGLPPRPVAGSAPPVPAGAPAPRAGMSGVAGFGAVAGFGGGWQSIDAGIEDDAGAAADDAR